jgi:hypothetical protein
MIVHVISSVYIIRDLHNDESVLLCGHCLDRRDNRGLTIKAFFMRAVPLSFRSGSFTSVLHFGDMSAIRDARQ